MASLAEATTRSEAAERRRARPLIATLPAVAWLLAFFATPLVIFAVYSVLTNQLYAVGTPFTLDAYRDALTSSLNRTLARNSLEVGLTTAAVTVITAEDIATHPGNGLAEVLRDQAGVQVRSLYGSRDGAYAAVDLRGFGETAAQNSLVIVDGRRLNDLDLAGCKLRIHRAALAHHHVARDGHDRFGAKVIKGFQRLAARRADHLGQAIMVAQVDEQHSAMIALAVDPAGKADGRSDIACSKVGAVMGTVGVH